MILKKASFFTVCLLFATQLTSFSQEKHYYQTDFSIVDFQERRSQIFEVIGNNSIALIQGAASIAGFKVFRQTNTFYYLCGLEAEHAYLLLNGKTKTSTIYLPNRDKERERSQGKILSAEDIDLVKKLTGVERVRGYGSLANDLVGTGLINRGAPYLYTPLSPAEIGNDSRDEILHGQARAASDPWDSQSTREARFKKLIMERFPQFEIRDLSPILDAMRLIKNPKEIEIIRNATEIAGLAIIEAMRSTSPGVYEYQLDAAAKYIFYQHGAQGDGYPSIIGGGTNAYMGHYFHKTDVLKDGDLVLMDYAPDYHYYTSDVTRIWPVNGKFNKKQAALYKFIVAYRDALFRYIKPGITSNEVLNNAAVDMKEYLIGKSFVKPAHLKAVQNGITFRGHFQHPVGMAVHDVGRVHGVTLQEGMVFTIDPMIWIPEERHYIRIEDVAVVTKTGVENLSDFVPSKIEDVERTIKEIGLTEFRPVKSLPLKN
ncbi:MAG: aminopeptidase P family protein [Flavobacteriaceae bacterium]|jgi:Xaa-Pro aminopeptidase|nr:aminopeptidase P family protein [Flavobacteriaceae bacterium]MBT4113442.1 aminopeptidase P family protein [Flavobacteriaceae bacterium]MBT4613542.1 aminopeptidase P family protein [Flavobacteriaceae bacterium]MBT5246260.1 aminopeptidase P family protein [Flavobacteriaceae bacterium]MBT5650466.1 aminopeptidase P family protein [Flavobacteriaceae bacterium]